jgi:hypothetical protein
MWLQVVGLLAFAVLLGTGFVAFSQGRIVGSRTTFGALLAAGVVAVVVSAV